jgi:hypothetical protein
MKNPTRRAVPVCLLAAVFCVQTLHAQTSTAQITGRVSDPSDAVVAGAAIHVRNLDTGVQRETTTTPAGYYTVPLLDPGSYEVAVQMPGFKPMKREGVVLQVDQVARIDFALELGSASETVLVEAKAPLLDAATSSLGNVVENRQITELPMQGRNTIGFMVLTPGVRMQGNAGVNENTIAINSRGNFSANGGIANANEVLVDGAAVSMGRGNAIGFMPPVDATREFKVETNSYSAEYGRSAGAVINLSVKSGTNQLHGSAYDFLRNNDLDANNFFLNMAGQPRAKLAFNQYGASLGGPIRRDRTFVFGNFEGFNQRQGYTLTTTVPTTLQRAGDFSQTFALVGGQPQQISIADPLSTVHNANGTYTRTVYPGNVLPASQLNNVALKYQQLFWPLPNQPGVRYTNVNNSTTSAVQPIDAYQGVMRVDHTLNGKWKLFATYAQQQINRGFFDLFHNKIGAHTQAYQERLFNLDGVLGATAIFSPHWIGEFRSSFLRFGQDRIPPNNPFDVTSIGWPAALGKAEQFLTVPSIQVSGVIGPTPAATSTMLGRANNWTETTTMTWLHSNHTVKFGWNYRPMQMNDVANTNPGSTLSFTGQFTSTNALAATATSGVGYASYLLGYPITGQIMYNIPLADSRGYLAGFIQDDWKLTRRLTLNIGLQYSLDSSITDRYNRVMWFDPTAVPPIGKTVGLPLVGALQFGSSGTRSPEDLYKKQWAPRIGFAFQAASKTVIRGGFGIFWLPNNLQGTATGTRATAWASSTTFVGSLDGGITPHDTLSNPFPNSVNYPPGSSGGLNSLIGQDLSVYRRSNHTGYVQNGNFNIQQDIWKNIVVDIAYAVSKGTGLPLDFQLNQLPVQYMSMGSALTQQVPNPFYGQVTSGILSAATVARGQLLRPYPQFGNVLANGTNTGMSIYHSMQLKISKRLGSSLIYAAYTLSKGISDSESTTPGVEGQSQPGGPAGPGQVSNNYNLRLDRSLVEYDAPQRLVVSYTLDLPFGKGQRYFTNPGVLNRFVAGWQLTGLYTAQSGLPVFLSTAANLTGAYVNVSRPNNNGTSAKLSGDAHSRLNEWFNTSAFSPAPAFTFGNAGRTLPDVRTHGTNNLDLGIFKNNPFGREGRFNLQIRGELFNTFNRVQFYYPGLVVGTPQLGVVSAQLNSQRLIQLAMKFLF